MSLIRRAALALGRLGRAIDVDVRDVALLLGIGLLWAGLWQIWKPLPYIVIGALLIRMTVGPLLVSPKPRTEERPRRGTR